MFSNLELDSELCVEAIISDVLGVQSSQREARLSALTILMQTFVVCGWSHGTKAMNFLSCTCSCYKVVVIYSYRVNHPFIKEMVGWAPITLSTCAAKLGGGCSFWKMISIFEEDFWQFLWANRKLIVHCSQ